MIANPQKENGHTDIANELLDFLCSFRIPGECRQVFDTIIRKTWGWHKKEDYIAGTQIVNLTKMQKGNVSRALSKLITNKLVIKSDNKLRINKNYLEWLPFGVIKSDNKLKVIKKATKVIRSDNKKLSEVRDTKEKKETIQKKASSLFDNLNNKEIKKISEKYKISTDDVVEYKESYILWISEKPNDAKRKGRNMSATVKNWIRRDLKNSKDRLKSKSEEKRKDSFKGIEIV